MAHFRVEVAEAAHAEGKFPPKGGIKGVPRCALPAELSLAVGPAGALLHVEHGGEGGGAADGQAQLGRHQTDGL